MMSKKDREQARRQYFVISINAIFALNIQHAGTSPIIRPDSEGPVTAFLDTYRHKNRIIDTISPFKIS